MRIEHIPQSSAANPLGGSKRLETAQVGICVVIGALLVGGFGIAVAEFLMLTS